MGHHFFFSFSFGCRTPHPCQSRHDAPRHDGSLRLVDRKYALLEKFAYLPHVEV